MRRFNVFYLIVFALLMVAMVALVTMGQGLEGEIENVDDVRENRNAYLINRAFAFWFNGQIEAALLDFDDAIAQDPTDADLYVWRGFARTKIDDYSGALADYEQVVTLQPDSARGYVLRGVLKINLGREEEGAADCQKALELERADGNDEGVANVLDLCGIASEEEPSTSAQQ